MEQSESSALGVLLRRYRVAAGLTQAELGERARVSARTVSDIERGIARRPQTYTALQLADALGLVEDDRGEFLDAARGRQVPRADHGQAGPEPTGTGDAARSPHEATSTVDLSEPEQERAGILPFPQVQPERSREAVLTHPIGVVVIAALMVMAAVGFGARVLVIGHLSAAGSTAAGPVLIGTWGTHVTGPFPIPHMWNLTVLPNGRIAVITYKGVDEYPVEVGVDELSASGDLLWSWAVHSSRNSGLSGLAGDARGDLYLAARYWKEIDKFSPDGRLMARWGPGLGLKGPTRVAVDTQGNVWVLDFDASRLLKLSPSGKLLAAFGSAGSGIGQFTNPDGLAVGPNGNLYIVDWMQDRVTEYSTGGRPTRSWGGTGEGRGELLYPRGVATDSAGNLYVADTANARIQKFTASGHFLATWGRRGTGPGEFSYPTGIFVAPTGNVYVADDGNSHYCSCWAPDRIEIFSPSGRYLSEISASVLQHPMLSDISALAVDSRGDIYAADDGGSRVVAFGPNHLPIHGWGGSALADANGIAVDSAGDVLVSDSGNNRVVRFTSRGLFLQQWKSINRAAYFFSDPYGIAVDRARRVFVADNLSQRVEELNPEGALLRSWPATFSSSSPVPYDALATNAAGSVYVGNEASLTVDMYTSNGKYLGSVGGQGSGVGSLRSISGIAVDARGRVYVVDAASKAVSVFSPSGTLLARWTASRFPGLGQPRAIALDHAGHIYVGGGHQIVELAPLA